MAATLATVNMRASSAFAGRTVRGSTSAARVQVAKGIVCAAARPSWAPGAEWPKHLDGSLPGTYGFDPLNLGANPEALRWYQQSELVHGRTAMAAVAGILLPAIATKAGILNVPEWYNAGKVAIEAGGPASFASFNTLLVVQFYLYGWVETKRWMDFRKPGSQAEPGSFGGFEAAFGFSKDNGYPGGAFDPLELSQNEKIADEYKLKEIKNGRLAMLAFIGFAAQFAATGKGPLDNLADHLANPALNNFTTNGVSVPFF